MPSTITRSRVPPGRNGIQPRMYASVAETAVALSANSIIISRPRLDPPTRRSISSVPTSTRPLCAASISRNLANDSALKYSEAEITSLRAAFTTLYAFGICPSRFYFLTKVLAYDADTLVQDILRVKAAWRKYRRSHWRTAIDRCRHNIRVR